MELLSGPEVVRQFPVRYKPKGSLPYAQQPTTGPCTAADERNPHPPLCLFIYYPFQ